MESASKQEEVIFYGTRWCFDCKRSEKFLKKNGISFHRVDIDKDPAGRAYVEEVNNGARSVPTIRFPDGDILVEPSNDELAKKLGLIGVG